MHFDRFVRRVEATSTPGSADLGNIVCEGSLQLNEVDSAISTLRRKRRKHPSLIKTRDGVEAIVPGLSTWTVEDLLEAGAWDDELLELADFEEVYPDDSDRY